MPCCPERKVLDEDGKERQKAISMAGPPPRRCRTDGFAGYACSYSPFFPDKLAVASAANFGLVGNGRLHILDAPPGPAGPLHVAKALVLLHSAGRGTSR